MFGIKTKKDKKIEELQKEIDTLKAMSLTTFINNNNDVKTLCAEYAVPFIALDVMSKKRIKRVLASKMVEAIDENLEIEYTTDNSKHLTIYTGKLNIVKNS